jgi:peptidoglycan/LPS O-acetylase OafA/YrhL
VFSHLWSISVEEQFYVLWPSVCRILSRRLLGFVCCGLCVVCLAVTWVLAMQGAALASIWLNSFTQSTFLASGALLALAIGMRPQRKSAWRAGLAVGCGLLLWFAQGYVGGFNRNWVAISPWRITAGWACIALGCGLLVWGFLSMPLKFLPSPLFYLGRISYGLYVFHGLVVEATRGRGGRVAAMVHLPGTLLAAQLLITIAIAALSYELLEKPFLKLKSRFELVRTRAA